MLRLDGVEFDNLGSPSRLAFGMYSYMPSRATHSALQGCRYIRSNLLSGLDKGHFQIVFICRRRLLKKKKSAASLHAGLEYSHRNESRGYESSAFHPRTLTTPRTQPFSPLFFFPSLACSPANANPNSSFHHHMEPSQKKRKAQEKQLRVCPPQATPAPHQQQEKT